MIELNEKDGAVTFKLRVQPRASRTEFVGELDGAVKVRVSAPPVEGKANEECRRFLAKLFGVGLSSVEIVSGSSGRNKVVRVHNVSIAQLREAFDRASQGGRTVSSVSSA